MCNILGLENCIPPENICISVNLTKEREYPVASDRGGTAADKANYVMLLSEMRDALGDDYGITATLPSSYWYMQNFDIANMEPYLDWFNIMSESALAF